MSTINDIKLELDEQGYFSHLSDENWVRILDTPHVWGLPFGQDIMPQAISRQAEFERAIVETVQHARYRCDIASLNSPDPDWTKAILGAIDTAMTKQIGRTEPTQLRFLFGQTPMVFADFGLSPSFVEFKAALVRLVRSRKDEWEVIPEIWVGIFSRLMAGIENSIAHKFLPPVMQSDSQTKMTWNHSKIIAVDGVLSLVGGHNLNMDLFRSYPPVHDVSVVVHGNSTLGSQLYLNEMWSAGTDLLTKELLDTEALTWSESTSSGQPSDPLDRDDAKSWMESSLSDLLSSHESGHQDGTDPEPPSVPDLPPTSDIRDHDLRTLTDLEIEVFEERITYNTFDKFDEYKKADQVLSVGKYWSGAEDFQTGSEVMKKSLILGAQRFIRMSQMDLISAWKKHWSDHVVCHWIIEALVNNPNLTVQIVVSPLDAGAGAEGDAYSFGSGAIRTFEIFQYYMTHNEDDSEIPDPDGVRANALDRLWIAPLVFTDQGLPEELIEGETYKWPDITEEGRTASVKQSSISPPLNGVINSPLSAVYNGSGYFTDPVDSAPGNHAKIMIIDDERYVVGSDNLYPGNLSEFNYLVEGQSAVNELLNSYWNELWKYSEPYAVNIDCVES